MQRAGLFIGVQKTGGLPQLKDAVASAQRMHAWALSQGMEDGTSALLVTDEHGPVGIDALSDAVQQLIDKAQPEQLIVYFAGHGVALRSGEHWLLSKAPGNPNAAVDVRWSADIASSGMVPHVVIISDACRTAPEGIQAQGIQGGSIFSNAPTSDQRFVDLYFACTLGRPAAEIQDSESAATSYRAVYTEVLLEALQGSYREAFVQSATTDHVWYADARKVRDVLRERVPKKIRSKRLKARYGQVPQAMILSDPGAWLAQLEALPPAEAEAEAEAGAEAGAEAEAGATPQAGAEAEAETGAEAAEPATAASTVAEDRPKRRGTKKQAPRRARKSSRPGPIVIPEELLAERRVLIPEDLVFARERLYRPRMHPGLPPELPDDDQEAPVSAELAMRAGVELTSAALASPHGPDHFESGCGLKVRGARIAATAVAPDVAIEQVTDGAVRVHLGRLPFATLVVQLESGDVVAAPLVGDFITSLTIDEGELIAVELEPTTNSPRWSEYSYEADSIRELRARAAAASAYGTFEPGGEEFQAVARRMQSMKSLDPILSIYAAYAYYALRQQDRIEEMADYLHADLRVRLFDLELLSGHLRGRQPLKSDGVLPSMPLLSQGWSLVHSHGTRMPAGLGELGRLAKDSVWSLYRSEAYELLARALERRRIR